MHTHKTFIKTYLGYPTKTEQFVSFKKFGDEVMNLEHAHDRGILTGEKNVRNLEQKLSKVVHVYLISLSCLATCFIIKEISTMCSGFFLKLHCKSSFNWDIIIKLFHHLKAMNTKCIDLYHFSKMLARFWNMKINIERILYIPTVF